MTDRYENIRRALAMGPTPGPWVPKELPRDMQRDGYRFSISRGGLGWWIAKVTHEANGGSGAANAALIAACDPDTISELLAERDQLAAALEAAQAERDAMREALKDADNELDWLDEDVDTCDHSVGVCTCSYWGMRRKMKAALAKENRNG